MSVIQFVAEHFQRLQLIILGLTLFTAFFVMKDRNPGSRFKSRESDRQDLDQILKRNSDLANAKLTKKSAEPKAPPLQLPGIRMVGESHEILGVRADATEAEVMKAYKDGMKRFHPDRIQGQAQEQLKFYQEASSKLNQAKEEMLKKIRSGS